MVSFENTKKKKSENISPFVTLSEILAFGAFAFFFFLITLVEIILCISSPICYSLPNTLLKSFLMSLRLLFVKHDFEGFIILRRLASA